MTDKMTRDEVLAAFGQMENSIADHRERCIERGQNFQAGLYLEMIAKHREAVAAVSALYDEVEAYRNALEKIKLRCAEHPDDDDADRKRNLYHAHSIAKFALDRSSGSCCT